MTKILAVDLENNEPFIQGEEVLMKGIVKSATLPKVFEVEVNFGDNVIRPLLFTKDGLYHAGDPQPYLFHCKEIDLTEIETLKAENEELKKKLNQPEGETTFENAKVNDVVYSIIYGKGTVVEREEDYLIVSFSFMNEKKWFFVNGALKYDALSNENDRTLFWSKPIIIAPAKPKEMVKKEVWRAKVDGEIIKEKDGKPREFISAPLTMHFLSSCTNGKNEVMIYKEVIEETI